MPFAKAHGVEFTLTSLCEQVERDGEQKSFAAAQTFDGITRRFDILKRITEALVPSSEVGWKLVDELPDTDQFSGVQMSKEVFPAVGGVTQHGS